MGTETMANAGSGGRDGERGAVLSFVLMVVAVLSVLATAMSTLVRVDTMQQVAQEAVSRNFLAAEAGVNVGIGEFRNIFLDLGVPQGDDFDPRYYDGIDGHQVRYRLTEVPPGEEQVTLPAGDAFAGLNSIRYRYTVLGEDLHPDGNPRARLGAQFDVHNVPIFQFLFFYADDLGFSYPARMELHGRVHTNGDLYLNAAEPVSIGDSPEVTTVQVSAAGRIWRRDAIDSACTGRFTIDTLQDVVPPSGDLDPRDVPCGEVTESVAAAWRGSLLPGFGNITPPTMDSIRRGDGTFWERADLRVVLVLDGMKEPLDPGCVNPNAEPPLDVRLRPIEVQNADGSRNVPLTDALRRFMFANPGKVFYNEVPSCTRRDTICAGSPTAYPDAFPGPTAVYRRADDANRDPEWTSSLRNRCDYRRGGFFNNREKRGPFAVSRFPLAGAGSWMHLLDVDLGALLEWNRAQGPGSQLFDPDDASDGGIVVFLSVEGPASDDINNYGVRVFDSANLGFPAGVPDPTGVTVVSDQAIYVQGNYNSSENKAPAALIGDTLNVLSEAWEGNDNDKRSTYGVASRPGSGTIVNAAFLSGTDPDLPGERNGGVNNYPRFHEWWNGALDYKGSMVSLGTPKHANGAFCGARQTCDIYAPPIREWDYDPDFDDVRFLPPLTPRVVWVQQTLFTQEFR